MPREIEELELSMSEDSVSLDDNSMSNSDDDSGWRICLKRGIDRDVAAADVRPSEPDGEAAILNTCKIKN